jgi:hypothetical protein
MEWLEPHWSPLAGRKLSPRRSPRHRSIRRHPLLQRNQRQFRSRKSRLPLQRRSVADRRRQPEPPETPKANPQPTEMVDWGFVAESVDCGPFSGDPMNKQHWEPNTKPSTSRKLSRFTSVRPFF